jgi:hypothetical protein
VSQKELLAGSTRYQPLLIRVAHQSRPKLDVGFRQLAGLAEILLFLPASKQTGFAMF